MDIVQAYLEKHRFQPSISQPPVAGLNLCLALPCYNEPDILPTLEALHRCTPTQHPVEVIVVVNAPEGCTAEATKQNLQTLLVIEEWTQVHNSPNRSFYTIYRPGLTQKHAGVGWARKIGMDEALYRLYAAGNLHGVIAGFDADSVCDTNYLTEMEKHFATYPKVDGTSIYFEHPLFGDSYPTSHYDGIALYELHLRYMNMALRYTKHPFAWHTVGSSFAVRASAYLKQGGMNRRQAGEDFYFLQKIIEAGVFSDLNTTRVVPSPRISNRVPFGTGASMTKWNETQQLTTYNLDAYKQIKLLVEMVDGMFSLSAIQTNELINQLPEPLKQFMTGLDALSEIEAIRNNCATQPAFRHRFFRWFNAFKVIRFLNTAHEYHFAKSDITEQSLLLLKEMGVRHTASSSIEILAFYREMERNSPQMR